MWRSKNGKFLQLKVDKAEELLQRKYFDYAASQKFGHVEFVLL